MYVCTECMIDVVCFDVFVAVRMLMLMLMLFMETVVFQNSQLYYSSFSCFISKLSSNRESVLQCVPIFFHLNDMIKPIFTSLPY